MTNLIIFKSDIRPSVRECQKIFKQISSALTSIAAAAAAASAVAVATVTKRNLWPKVATLRRMGGHSEEVY